MELTPALCSYRKERKIKNRMDNRLFVLPSSSFPVSTTTISRSSATTSSTTPTTTVFIFMVTDGRRASLELFAEFLISFAHIRISHMHFSKKVVCQSTIVVKTTQVCTAHVADLQFLMARGTGGILKVLQFPLAGLFLVFGSAGFVQFVQRKSHGTGLAEDGDFE